MSTSGGASGSPQVSPESSSPGMETRNSRIATHLSGTFAAGGKAAACLGRIVIRSKLGPALGVSQYQIGDRPDVGGSRVEAGDGVQRLTTGFLGEVGILHGYFLERLQAIHGEAGADHVDTLDPVGAEFLHGFIGVRM